MMDGSEQHDWLVTAEGDKRGYIDAHALTELWSGRADTQRLWQAVGIALQNEALITRIDMRDERVSLRGEAPDASQVLAALR